MSKRHTFNNTGLDPTLVFYAPLDEGDFYDHISGVEMIPQPSIGTITWDTVRQAYHFYQASYAYGYLAKWNNLNLDIDITNWGFTMIADFGSAYTGTNENQYRCIDVGGLVTQGQSGRVIIQPNFHTANYGTTTNEIHRLAVKYTYGGASYMFTNGYRNNEWYKPGDVVSAWSPNNNANIFKRDTSVSNDTVKTMITIGRCQGGSQTTNIWVKNIRIYNRELTIPEIISL